MWGIVAPLQNTLRRARNTERCAVDRAGGRWSRAGGLPRRGDRQDRQRTETIVHRGSRIRLAAARDGTGVRDEPCTVPVELCAYSSRTFELSHEEIHRSTAVHLATGGCLRTSGANVLVPSDTRSSGTYVPSATLIVSTIVRALNTTPMSIIWLNLTIWSPCWVSCSTARAS